MTTTMSRAQRARKAPWHLSAADIASITCGKFTPAAIKAAVGAYAARAELPGWQPGADGVLRVDYHEVSYALGIAPRVWGQQFQTWADIRRAMGSA